jgi:5-methyltetrahydropteroyltriglutamate--homocysteine methyltransferase
MSHAGSLHRPPTLAEAMRGHKDGDPFDDNLETLVRDAVQEVVRLQAENGVDVVNDGEYSKSSWQTYARGRLGGIELRDIKEGEPVGTLPITAREQLVFPEYFDSLTTGFAGGGFARQGVYAVGPLTYKGQAEVERDIRNIRDAIKGQNVVEPVLTGLAPGTIEHWLRNDYYKTDEECLFAVADAMHEEYKMITDAGIILQLDDPDLPDGYACHPELSAEEYRKFAEVRVEAINHSIRDIPEEMIRLHICWGSIHHPHTQDLPLKDIIDVMYKVKAQCYSIEAANPQHEHEWEVFAEHKLPDGKIIMPGVLGHAAREFVEHPELVAQRLIRYANLVGKENVIGGTDCGLQRTAHPSITWAKFRAGAEGAAIATKKLWG